MTRVEFDQLQPDFSVVNFANANYVVASKDIKLGVPFVGIYDEPPSLHIDFIKAESCTYVPYLSTKSLKNIKSEPPYKELQLGEVYKVSYDVGTTGTKMFSKLIMTLYPDRIREQYGDRCKIERLGFVYEFLI